MAAQAGTQQKQKLRWSAEAQGDGITVLDPDPAVGTRAHQAQDFCSETELSRLVVGEILGSREQSFVFAPISLAPMP